MHIRSRFPHYHGDAISQAVELQLPALLMTQAVMHTYVWQHLDQSKSGHVDQMSLLHHPYP